MLYFHCDTRSVSELKGVSTDLEVMASPGDAAPVRVDSLAKEERASEAYLAALIQANPQLMDENHTVYESVPSNKSFLRSWPRRKRHLRRAMTRCD